MFSNWNWNQYKAAGKNIASYGAGLVSALLAIHLISSSDASSLTEGISQITSGLEQVAKGIGILASVLVPIYTALRSAHNASPQAQMNSVVQNLSAPQATQVVNAIADPLGRNKLIDAVATMPEVKKIVATPIVAEATASNKVVAS